MKNTISKLMVVGALMVGGTVMAADAPMKQPAKSEHAAKAPAKPAADTNTKEMPAPAHHAEKGAKHHKG